MEKAAAAAGCKVTKDACCWLVGFFRVEGLRFKV